MNKIKTAILIGDIFLLILQFINLKSMLKISVFSISNSILYGFKYFINYLLSIIIIILMIVSLSI